MVGWPSVKKTTVKLRLVLVVAAHVEGGQQCVVDVGPAVGLEFVHPAAGFVEVLARGGDQVVLVLRDGGGEVDDVEAILRAEVAQAELQRLLGLDDAGALHAAGRVQHEHHVAGHLLRLGQLRPRRNQHHEVAVSAGLRVVHQRRQADVLAGGRVVQLKILRQRGLATVEMHARLAVVDALDADAV